MEEYRKIFEDLEKYEESHKSEKSKHDAELNVNNKKYYGLIHGIFSFGSKIFLLIYAILGYYLGIGKFNFYMGLLIILSIVIVSLFFNILEYYGYGPPDSPIKDSSSFLHELLINIVGFLIIFFLVGIVVKYLFA